MSTPPGNPYVYKSSSTVTSASDFKVEVNGTTIGTVDITGKSGDWTITIAGLYVTCPEGGGNGEIKIYHKDGSNWVLEHTEEISPCD